MEKVKLFGADVSEADVLPLIVPRSKDLISSGLKRVGGGGLGKISCSKTPWELLVKDLGSMWSCWPGTPLLLPSDGGSRGVSEPLGDGGPGAEHHPQSQFLLLFLAELLRWVSSNRTMWRVGVDFASPHPPKSSS